MQCSTVPSKIFSYVFLLFDLFFCPHYTDLAGRYGCPSYTSHKKGTRHSYFECTVFLLSAFAALLLHRKSILHFSILPNLPLILIIGIPGKSSSYVINFSRPYGWTSFCFSMRLALPASNYSKRRFFFYRFIATALFFHKHSLWFSIWTKTLPGKTIQFHRGGFIIRLSSHVLHD